MGNFLRLYYMMATSVQARFGAVGAVATMHFYFKQGDLVAYIAIKCDFYENNTALTPWAFILPLCDAALSNCL